MKNITVSINDNAYYQARVWAARCQTSVSAIVAHFLERLPGLPIANHAVPLEGPVSPKPPATPTEAI
jgi:hypothetical protein